MVLRRLPSLFVQRRYGACEKGPTVSHAHGTTHQGATAEQDANSALEARLAAGADGVIDDVYAAHGSAVLGYLRRFVPHDDAEDVLQRVFYEVWRHQRRYDPSRSLAAWIFGIARNRAIDPSAPPTRHISSARRLGRSCRGGWSRRGRTLRAGQRGTQRARPPAQGATQGAHVGLLRGLHPSEIAARLKLPLGTVKASTFRGLRRLTASLAPEQGQTRPT
jgi:DNA-directed RNA polymerase specialized sigma24 family protein